MRISVILPHLRKFGGVRRYLEFGNCVVEKNHHYDIFVVDYNEDYEWVRELGFKGGIKNTKDLVSDEYDVCICGDAGSLHMLDTAKAKVKVVNVIFPPFSSFMLGNYGKYLERDDLVVIGNSTGWNGPIPWRDNYRTIPGAVNFDMFYPIESDEWDTYRILFMAKNRPWKGLETILAAYHVCKMEKINIEWGYFDTEEHPGLPKDMNAHINLPQSKMAELYSTYDCFLSAEELAGWQNCAAEAMACQKLVITTEIGSRDFAIDKETAIVVPQKDPRAIVNAIKFAMENVEKCTEIAKTGRERIQNFSWDAYTDKWLNTLGGIVYRSDMSDTANTIKAKAKELIKPVEIQQRTEPKVVLQRKVENIKKFSNSGKGSKAFDKYEKFGAYHWNSKDEVYNKYVDILVSIFAKLKTTYRSINVLDVGGGDGNIAGRLSDLGLYVKLIDTNATAIKLATDKLNQKIAEKKIAVSNEDFMKVTEKFDCILLSQVIEHFHQPETVIEKIGELEPSIVIVTTPIKKEDGGWWDKDYHVKEYNKDEFVNLFSSLLDRYSITYAEQGIYNQYLILEHKVIALKEYLSDLNLSKPLQDGDQTKGTVLCSDQDIAKMIQMILKINSNTPQTLVFKSEGD